jgi:glutamate-1-semialdehyde aminotransferase
MGYADFLFGHKLDYDSDNGFFIGSARIIAAITDNGTVYADTTTAGNGVPIAKGAIEAETLKIDLPARQD